MPTWLAIAATAFVFAVLTVFFFARSPGDHIHDLRVRAPESVTGVVAKLVETEGPGSMSIYSSPGETTWHVNLEDGTRFEIGWGDYRRLAPGDKVWICFYPATRLVTAVRKLPIEPMVSGLL
jgi:hypothetical protein